MKLLQIFRKKDNQRSGQKDDLQLTRTEALQCIPLRSETVEWIVVDDDNVQLEYPISIKPFFLSLAKRFNKQQQTRLTKKLQLDETGSRVWHLLDGSTNVKTLIRIVAKETGLTLQEAELAVTTFLRELGQRGLIILRNI